MATLVTKNLDHKLSIFHGIEDDSSDEDHEPSLEKKATKQSSSTVKPKITDKSKNRKKQEHDDSNVIYLGHLPSNFEEAELRQFLSQFGNVTHVRVSRSRKTANSRGYGFVEFDDPEVAQVVADTMSGYLIGQKRLVCHLVPKDKIHPNLFKGADRVFTKLDWAGRHRKIMNRPKSVEKIKEITQRLVSRERKRREKLKAAGIDYEFPGYAASNEASPALQDSETRKPLPNNKPEEISEPPSKKSKISKIGASKSKHDVVKLDEVVKSAEEVTTGETSNKPPVSRQTGGRKKSETANKHEGARTAKAQTQTPVDKRRNDDGSNDQKTFKTEPVPPIIEQTDLLAKKVRLSPKSSSTEKDTKAKPVDKPMNKAINLTEAKRASEKKRKDRMSVDGSTNKAKHGVQKNSKSKRRRSV